MTLFDYSRRRWLFCMTHPDDEISICLWIKKLVDNGNEVFLSWTHSNAIREAEARKVSALLGVPEENLVFHSASDGVICKEFADLLPKFAEMMGKVQPDVVVCGAFEQGHVDHDTTNVLVNMTFKGDVMEVPFYHTYMTRFQEMNVFSDTSDQSILVLEKGEASLKRTIAKQYRSQNIWSVLFLFEAWQVLRGRQIQLAKREVMRVQQHKMFRIPNHPSYIVSALEKNETWQWWCDHVLPHVPG